jgi:hypothetical protein
MQWPENREAIWRYMPRGIRISIRRTTWQDHICLGHPELHNCLGDVLKAIERPEAVYQSGNTRYSYTYSVKRGSFIMLIYKVNRNLGWVLTAYTVQNPYVEVEGLNRVWPI